MNYTAKMQITTCGTTLSDQNLALLAKFGIVCNDDEVLPVINNSSNDVDTAGCTQTGAVILDGEFEGSQVLVCNGQAMFFNPQTQQLEELPVATVGMNPVVAAAAILCETRDFVFEVPADAGADVTITNADVLAALAGATFPGGLAADDALNVYLNKIDFTLTHIGDQLDGGFVTTTADASVTDVDANNVTNIEPGGNYMASQNAGTDVHDFSVTVADGSNVKVCGQVSIKLNEDGTAIPK